MASIRGRYAPSPSGRLHLGNARTALLAWLQVRALGGEFILRIEDLDPQRSKEAFARDLVEDLRWLGLDWDEGPGEGGAFGPYTQSACGEIYAAHAEGLETYPCTCTRRELRDAVRAPHGGTPIYPGTCRSGPSHPERPPALRVRVPEGSWVEFEDAFAGTVRSRLDEEVGDFAIRRSDGAWAYQLAVVVDDGRMGMTHVLRGADLLDSTARQAWLYEELGYPRPEFAHVPLVLGPDGRKLNKRHGAPDLGELRRGGATAEAVVARLAETCGLVGPHLRSVRASELVGDFALVRVPRAPVRLDPGVFRR